jgi:hypothetical protein
MTRDLNEEKKLLKRRLAAYTTQEKKYVTSNYRGLVFYFCTSLLYLPGVVAIYVRFIPTHCTILEIYRGMLMSSNSFLDLCLSEVFLGLAFNGIWDGGRKGIIYWLILGVGRRNLLG